jgi:hypothetical protein
MWRVCLLGRLGTVGGLCLSQQLCFVSVYFFCCKVGFRFGSSELHGFVGR